MNISPCLADNACKKNNGKCVLKDDMHQIYEALEESDAFILATPIYMWDVNAQAKLFIDRLYSYYLIDALDQFKGKKVSIIVSQGMDDENTFSNQINNVKNLFEMLLGLNVVDVEFFVGNNELEAICDKENQLEKAQKVGINLFG